MSSVARAQHLPQLPEARVYPANLKPTGAFPDYGDAVRGARLWSASPLRGGKRTMLDCFDETSYCSKFVKFGRVRCVTLPLSPRRRNARWGQARKCCPQACNAVAEGINRDDGTVQSKGASLFFGGLLIDSYPWAKLATSLMHRAANAVWFLGKWVVSPALILLALRDGILAVATENELWIPLGLLVGTLFTGILNETFSILGFDFQHNVLPWHLLEFGFFFVIMRVGASKIAPFWFRVFLYHFAIGGLWQTIRFCLDWKAKNERCLHEEENSESV